MKTTNVQINVLSTRKAYVAPCIEVFSLPEIESVAPIMGSGKETEFTGGAGSQGHSDGTVITNSNEGWFDTDESGFDAKWND